MRLAIFSDIHGNPIALDAVLADIGSSVDGYIIVGDHCAIGYDPASVIERLDALPNAHFVRGNTDRYTLTNDRPPPAFDDVIRNLQLLPTFLEVHGQFVWTRGFLEAKGLLGWLKALPLEYRLDLPDGTRLLAVHASPGNDDGLGIYESLSDDSLYELLKGANAELIFVGHYHQAHERHVQGIHCVNVASVSNPLSRSDEKRAHYVILEADINGYTVTSHRVAYDYQAVIDAIRRSHHPAADYMCGFWNR